MVSEFQTWHAFLHRASEFEPEVRTLLTSLDDHMRCRNARPFNLAKDGELVDALCRALAVAAIGTVPPQVKGSLKRHDAIGHLETVIECATIASGDTLGELDSVTRIEHVRGRLAQMLREA